jgi:gamma-glutamyltranspeptidase/glutathione hydrolase
MIISNRGGQSWLDPDLPNSLEPWKRPRLTPNPAIAFKDGKLFMPFATPGTDAQVQAMAQMFLNMVEFGMSPQQAVEEPRFVSYSFPGSYWPHSYYPGLVQLEGWIDRAVGDRLASKGHEVGWWEDWTWEAGGLCGIMVDPTWGTLVGGADLRTECCAIGG